MVTNHVTPTRDLTSYLCPQSVVHLAITKTRFPLRSFSFTSLPEEREHHGGTVGRCNYVGLKAELSQVFLRCIATHDAMLIQIYVTLFLVCQKYIFCPISLCASEVHEVQTCQRNTSLTAFEERSDLGYKDKDYTKDESCFRFIPSLHPANTVPAPSFSDDLYPRHKLLAT